MARFEGGPYDGMELPFDPTVLSRVNLPEKEHLDDFLNVPDRTSKYSWPHLYEADLSTDPPQYKFVERPQPRVG